MFTPWFNVRPSIWYPVASLEQSMHDFDSMLNSRFPLEDSHLLSIPEEEDDFFKDLPMARRGTSQEEKDIKPSQEKEHKRAYSNYSYSSSSMVDENGQRVESRRRRYEDSNGRLKAFHERKIGDNVMTTTWDRPTEQEEGKHLTVCQPETLTNEEFEANWAETPFGKAHAKKLKDEEDKLKKLEAEKDSVMKE